MQQIVAKLCLSLTLLHVSQTEWVEIAHSQAKQPQRSSEDLSTPSSVWLEYQRERFGLSHSNPLVVSDAVGLKHSTKIVVPNKSQSQIINTRTKLLVKSTAQPPVDIEVVVTPKVETTSRRHSTHDATETVAAPQPENGEHAGDLQLPSMQGFLKFLKSMQSTWIKKGALSIENKIKLLTQLRDNLVKVIEQHFAVLWQPERHRRKRGILDESNLEFPPEAALMSINFLTFAVFLIKLVLQVVKIVKSKHYSFSGFNVNTEVIRNPS